MFCNGESERYRLGMKFRGSSMKRLMLTSAAIVLTAGAAMAADLSVPFKAAPAIAPYYSWTGCYLGIHGGGASFRNSLAGTWSDGGVFGGQIGCNYQIDHLVVGVEGEGFWSGVDSTTNVAAGFAPGAVVTTTSFKNDWDADIAVRFGLAYDRFFFYEKIGVMWADNKFTNTTSGVFGTAITGSATSPGLFWGLGLEYGLTQNWTAKVETDFVHFAATDINLTCAPIANCGGGVTAINSTNSWALIAKLGLNYRW
jgi:outer membrane immunogenic protein